MTGFLKLYRDEPFIGEGKPFDRFHAWVDLRARASYYSSLHTSGQSHIGVDLRARASYYPLTHVRLRQNGASR